MAHNAKALSRFSSSGYTDQTARSIFFLATADAAATVLTAGYFNDSRAQLVKDDVIFAIVDINASSALLQLIVTAVPATGNVTVAAAEGALVGGQANIPTVPTNLANDANGTAIAAAVNGNAAAINAIIAALEASGITLGS